MRRRDFFSDIATGLAGTAAASLLGAATHHSPRAKQIIQIHLCGGCFADGYVRLQTGAREIRRTADARRRS